MFHYKGHYRRLAGQVWVVEIYSPVTKRWRRLKNAEWYNPALCPISTSSLDQRTENLAHHPRSNLEDTMRVLKRCKERLAEREVLAGRDYRLRVRNIDTQDVVLAEIL